MTQPSADPNSPLTSAAGEYGTLPEKQTVPRAEMWALYRCLKALSKVPQVEQPHHAQVHTDCSVVHKAFLKGPNTRHGPNGEIWDLIWDAYSIITAQGCRVTVHKLTSHAIEKGIAQAEH